jgi:hypothetical protein
LGELVVFVQTFFFPICLQIRYPLEIFAFALILLQGAPRLGAVAALALAADVAVAATIAHAAMRNRGRLRLLNIG